MSGSTSDPLAGVGQALSGATALASYVMGGHSSTASEVATNSSTKQQSNTSTSSTNTTQSETDTSGDTKTTNSADPAVIQMLKQLATSAFGNSTDTSKTSDLLMGILQNAKDSLTAVFGQQRSSGLYNSASAETIQNDTAARASADAAQAILGYQTTEQGIAADTLKTLGGLTATSDVASNSRSVTNAIVNDVSNTSTVASGTTTSDVVDHSKSKSGSSVVCTWMNKHGLLSDSKYRIVSYDLMRMHPSRIKGYLMMARPLVKVLESDSNSFLGRLILWVFTNRNIYVCKEHYSFIGLMPKEYRKWKGILSYFLVAIYCTPAILGYLLAGVLSPKTLLVSE